MIPGGLVALASLAAALFVAYRTWYQESLSTGTGVGILVLLAVTWIAGVFLFAYGYHVYDLKKALRLTVIVVIVGVLAVAIAAAVFIALKEGKGEGGSGRSGGSGGSRDGGGNRLFEWEGGPGEPSGPPAEDAGNVGPQPGAIPAVPCPGCGANRPVGSLEPCAICGTVLPA
jgi:hypothetical protein